MKKALFTGTFDPYTIGHDSVVRRALTFMDEIVIAVVERNVHKQSLFSNEQRVKMIQDLYADEPRVNVLPFHNLAVDFAKEQGAQFIIRGVRSISDFEYETNLKVSGKIPCLNDQSNNNEELDQFLSSKFGFYKQVDVNNTGIGLFK